MANETAPRAPDPGHDSNDSTGLAEQVTLSLAGSLNLRRTAMRLLALLRPQLADWAVVVVPEPRTGGLQLFGGEDTGFSAVIAQPSSDLPGLGRVLRAGRTEMVRHPGSAESLTALVPHPSLLAEVAALRPADVVAVGLTARGATFGALLLARRGFSDQDLAEAQAVATRAALALDSARLYEERARVAAALQRSLRPPQLPDIDGMRLAARYRPSAEHLDISGDFYDVLGAGDDWLLALGDVCGKGVEAAELTGRTRQSIRTIAHFDRRPAGILGALNTVLYESGADPFVTVLCGRLRVRPEDATADIELASAGHPAPIVLRADGTAAQVEVAGTAAGMVGEVGYHSARVRLAAGDTLLMFTDGIDEAHGADGPYGVGRLLALLPAYRGAAPDVICEAVEHDVLRYLNGRQHDDIALLAVTCGS